jgi:hypothetical protein
MLPSLARSLFRKGADFTVGMAFEMASTNLVLERGIIMLILLGRHVHGCQIRQRSAHGDMNGSMRQSAGR